MFPIYYHFKGGKGVATTAAMILMTNPVVFLIMLAIFAVIVIGTKYVSLASIMSAMLWPLILSRIEGAGVCFLISLCVAALVIFMHRDNIKRLYEGKENKLSFGKKKEKKEDEQND